MDNRVFLRLVMVVWTIFGSTYVCNAGCKDLKNQRERLKEQFIALRDDFDKTLEDLEEKQDNNQLTREYLLATVENAVSRIISLKTEVEAFKNSSDKTCPKCFNLNRCSSDSVRIERVKEKMAKGIKILEEFKTTALTELETPLITLVPIVLDILSGDYTGALGKRDSSKTI